MHEVSLVRNIFNTLRSEFSLADLPRIKAINITAGVLANIEPILLQNAFEAVVATDSPEFAQARLHVTTLPVRVLCLSCQQPTDVQHYTFVCAHCGQPCNNIIQGEELLIGGVELADAP
jgi:hydrogenase nickel incorporation protein HypA/HybF